MKGMRSAIQRDPIADLMTVSIMMQFFYYPSTNPAKVALFLEEAGLDYEVVPVDSRKGEQFSADYLDINPNGKMPALVDGSVKIFDSTAILLYLGRKTGRFLVQESPSDEAAMLSWMMLVATGLGPFCGQAMHFLRYAPEPREYALNRYMFEADRHWKLIETRLGEAEYLAGGIYSIADMSVWGWARSIPALFGADAWSKFPNVQRLIHAIDARPAAMRAIALQARYAFKQEIDEEARHFLFPHSAAARWSSTISR